MLIDWGNSRELLLALDLVFLTMITEIAFIFLYQYISNKERRITLSISIATFFVLLSCIAAYIHNYFLDFDWLFNVYGAMVALALLTFSVSVEKEYAHIIHTRHFFTFFSLGMFLILIFVPYQIGFYNVLIIIIELSYLFPLFLIFLIFKRNKGNIRNRMIVAMFAFILVLFGLILNNPRLRMYIFPMISYENFITIFVLAKILRIFGIYLLFLSFNTNIFLQFNWKVQLIELYIVQPQSKQILYHQRYNTNANSSQEDQIIFTGGIVGLVENFQEITNSKKSIKTVDEGRIKILIEKGTSVVCAFIVREDMEILHFILQQVTKEFENHYQGLLNLETNINTNLNVFKSFTPVIDQIFNQIRNI